MGLVERMVGEMAREIGSKTREFYEFVLPPIDMRIRGDRLVLVADMPGFEKGNVSVTLQGRTLRIQACKKQEDRPGGDGSGSGADTVDGDGGSDGDGDGGKGKYGGAAAGRSHGADRIICTQRPSFVDKKVRLPIPAYRPGERDAESRQREAPRARYEDGILTVTIPIRVRRGMDIAVE